ncbi:MAG: RNA-directed DNA polymerase, partial [Desulfitobacteriaceae bacterium]|nr:RNA-directed DNA polymerase [Desulfitobacteriaceae bacterium]
KKYVKDGMRNQPILDLHDYYDFHRNCPEILSNVRAQIIGGRYYPKTPYVVRTEKKLGICRHLQIPTPEDAVVLQTLVFNLEQIIKAAEPTKRAYYSRSHRRPKSESDIDTTYSYDWLELWREFQERIYEFNKVFDYVVVTDIANYFDNISFNFLRKLLSSYGLFEESFLDFLFYMLDAFVWRPDYLPQSGVGLPQIDFDAPRLLAHCFLFEIDKHLDKKTQGNFVRWMDDICFGVDKRAEAKQILAGMDDMLLPRGIRLNLGKTAILSQHQADDYFLPMENRYLSVLHNRILRKLDWGCSISDDVARLKKRFRKFIKKMRVGRWDKVYCRYFTLATVCKTTFLERYVPELLMENPSIRKHILRYYVALGPQGRRFRQLYAFYTSDHCFDDVTVFSVAKTIVDWPVSVHSKLVAQINTMALETAKNSSAHLIGSIWMMAKYGSSAQLALFIAKHSTMWRQSSFVSRQIAAVVPRIRCISGTYNYIERTLIESGQLDALRVLNHLNCLRNLSPLPGEIKLYLCHGKGTVKQYPLQKFLIAFDVLGSPILPRAEKLSLRTELLARIPDPLYRYYLQRIPI